MGRSIDMMVLGIDPGKRNFGVSIVGVSKTCQTYKIYKTCMLLNAVTDFKDSTAASKQAMAFKREVQGYLKKYKIDLIVVERFMVRGRYNGATSEYISAMIGILLVLGVKVCIVTPPEWKNAFNKKFDLKEVYKRTKIVPHIIDATLIGIYGAAKVSKLDKFKCVNSDIHLIKRLEICQSVPM
jgi:hypothetical protein